MTFSSFINIGIGLPVSPILGSSYWSLAYFVLNATLFRLHKISGICLSLPKYFGYRYSSPCLSLIMCTQIQIPKFVQQECQTMSHSHTQPNLSNPREGWWNSFENITEKYEEECWVGQFTHSSQKEKTISLSVI